MYIFLVTSVPVDKTGSNVDSYIGEYNATHAIN